MDAHIATTGEGMVAHIATTGGGYECSHCKRRHPPICLNQNKKSSNKNYNHNDDDDDSNRTCVNGVGVKVEPLKTGAAANRMRQVLEGVGVRVKTLQTAQVPN